MSQELYSGSECSLLIRRAQLLGRGVFDVRISGSTITALAEQLVPLSGESIVEAGCNLLLPGLHDHHLHLFATAAARASVVCGPPQVNNEVELEAALLKHCKSKSTWLRGVGFHDSVSKRIDRQWLDRVCGNRPVRIQHRSGMMWILNSCALSELAIDEKIELPDGAERGDDGQLSGRFYNLDAWLGERLAKVRPNLRDLSHELAAFGVTGLTDTGATNGRASWSALEAAMNAGELRQRLLVMGNEELHELVATQPKRMALGPLKIYLREVTLPELDALVARIATAHQHGRSAAFHCVSLVELHFAILALREAGVRAGDRIEHAAIADDYALDALAELGITVVTQPHFIAERGDQYLVDVDVDDVPLLYRGASFLRAGVALAAGSDAPYGGTDPWSSMRAAIARRTPSDVEIGRKETLSPLQALNLFGGELQKPGGDLRALAVGQVADLCLLALPWEQLQLDLDARHVALTLCDGQIIYDAAATQLAS